LFKAVNRPRLIKGVPSNVLLGMLVVGFAFALLAKMVSPWLLLIWIPMLLAYVILRVALRKDPDTFAIYKRYSAQGDHYDPWPALKPKRNRRPEGFGSHRWLR
jgi:type IV secretory pathway VirB3-like protein